ncbi:hypothetical protein Alches_12970 [Alicyclobacillus hesperidum subsp. aegles]|uniref:hypothetical protein n=1 Tax=Alicyclobacillus hesperidum TaxID=89784 RepID=UPI000719192A|nr:hypothetical protein [Alicyclobacillus hesperidum]KRW91056.1 hypothetical protein SD51_11345 [Alicyclobacillus tengchongensis]GLG01258.1 hypothetical protein Alches_12970 [Alicyclobacillus hesperidum subsp. aegles]
MPKAKLAMTISLAVLCIPITWTLSGMLPQAIWECLVAVVVASAFVYLFMGNVASFVWLAAQIFITGSGVTVYAWRRGLAMGGEWRWIALHLLYVMLSVSVWLCVSFLKGMAEQLLHLHSKVNSLEKTVSQDGLLTAHEFVYQVDAALRNMARREETGYLLILCVRAKHSKNALFHSLASAAVQSVRERFDLVGVIDNCIYMLLQRTEGEGVDTVLERIAARMGSYIIPSFRDWVDVERIPLPVGATVESIGLQEYLA